MRLFHQTKTQDAESIWNDGFRDLEVIVDDGCAGEKFVGVRLFDNSIGWNSNPDGNNLLLTIEIPEDAISEHELLWADDGIPIKIREFAVPAPLVNSYGPPVVEDVDLNPRGLLDDIDLSGIGDAPDSGGFAGPMGDTSPFGNN